MAGLLRKLSFVLLLLAVTLYSRLHFAEAREVFEKGDAIYSDLGENLPVWFLGHAGLYWEWPDTGDPDDYSDHKIIESTWPKVRKSDFEDFYNRGDFWSVRTTDLTATRRRIIVNTAKDQLGEPYRFFWGYKGPNGFRCDGLVEYCYEMAGIDIVLGDTWSPLIANLLPGRILLTPWRQMQRLEVRESAELWKVSLGKYDEFGEIYGPIYQGGEAVEPDAGGKYHVIGTCTIKAYASDTYKGSGLTLVELWLGYPDKTPEPTGPDDTTSIRLKRWDDNYDIEHDYAYDWGTTTVEAGQYTLYAKAFDQGGNTKVSDGVIVVISLPPGMNKWEYWNKSFASTCSEWPYNWPSADLLLSWREEGYRWGVEGDADWRTRHSRPGGGGTASYHIRTLRAWVWAKGGEVISNLQAWGDDGLQLFLNRSMISHDNAYGTWRCGCSGWDPTVISGSFVFNQGWNEIMIMHWNGPAGGHWGISGDYTQRWGLYFPLFKEKLSSEDFPPEVLDALYDRIRESQ